MALINCPECNKEVSESVTKCPHCGYKFQKKKKEKRIIFKTPKQKKIFIIGACVVGLALLGTGGFLGYKFYFEPLGRYNTGAALVKEEKFDDAIKVYENLGDFKDSKNKVLETHYNKAKTLVESQDYNKAVEELELAKSYEGAEELLKETKYTWAQSSNDIDVSIRLYTELGDYNDSKSKLEEAQKRKKKQEALQKLKSAANRCKSIFTELSSDGKSIIMDAYGEYDFTSVADVKTIISCLGLPESLYEEMSHTTALMGRQSDKFENFEVSWSYHPDNGLDVIFKLVD